MRLETTMVPLGTMPNGLQGTPEGLWVIDQGTDEVYLLDGNLEHVRTVATVSQHSSGVQ